MLGLQVAAAENAADREVTGGYCGDLLSDVMANAAAGALWITMQSHQNIVAVALLRDLAGIILVNGRVPDEDTRRKAEEEGIPILLSGLGAFQVAGRIYAAGVGVKEA